MPRVDFSWGPGVHLREQSWGWRHEITKQVINPDIDGLMTACLLHHVKGWPVVGLYDTQRLYLDAAQPLPLDMRTTIWVDADMCWPGSRSLSQHVITDAPGDGDVVDAYQQTVNPSLLHGHSRQRAYTSKYPFGTFQWAWHLIGAKVLGPRPAPSDRLRTGLAWMPDGGFLSVRDQWRQNCLRWSVKTLPGSILGPLAQTDPDLAEELVADAAEELRSRSGVQDGWRNHQFTLTTGSGNGPRLTMPFDEGVESIRALCDVICEIYGWRRVALPRRWERLEGTYHSTATPPPGWPDAANRGEVVSLAVTRANQFCWTGPGDLVAALPPASSSTAPN